MSDGILTLKETADYLKVHWQTVRSYIKSGKLKAVKVGRRVRVKESDVHSFLNQKVAPSDIHEIELRFLTSDRKAIEARLLDIGAKNIYSSHVIDHWFVPNRIKNLKQKDEWYETCKGYGLRIREQDNGYTGKVVTSLEAKCLVTPYQHDHCIEHEIEVSDYDEAQKLLRLMNLKEIITIDKDRIAYKYNGFKIIIDDIRGFITGIEIETMTDKSREQVVPKINKIAKQIGIDVEKDRVEKSLTYLAMEKFGKF